MLCDTCRLQTIAAAVAVLVVLQRSYAFVVPPGPRSCNQEQLNLNSRLPALPRPSFQAPVTSKASSADSRISDAVAGVFIAAVIVGGCQRARQVTRRANLVATTPYQAVPWWDRIMKHKVESGMGLWAEKVNMTIMYDESGYKQIPATILAIKRGGNLVTGKKWPERHGRYAIQVGYDRYIPDEEELKGPAGIKLSMLASNELPPLKKLTEFRVRPDEWQKWKIGDKVWPSDIFKEGDVLDIHGRTKAKGFQGAIAKWGHKRGPMTHGSKHHRRFGSMGAGTDPGRVFPFKKRPGWTGDHKHTAKGIKILKIIDRIDEDNMPESIIVVKGSVAGYTAHTEQGGSYVYLHKKKNPSDGRNMRDPVWMWFVMRGEDEDIYVPKNKNAWSWRTHWGRDCRWITQEVKKYWPDGFPGYDHSQDPFYDDCDPHKAIKAPNW